MQDVAGKDTSGADYTRNPQVVIGEEKQHLHAAGSKERLCGLALSGGGIRSASFATGVLQAFVARDLLRTIDYLSTVSGGGYIGSSLTWFLHQGLPGNLAAGTGPSDFPFGEGGVGGRTGKRSAILDFIRQHGNYLIPGKGLNLVSLIGIALRGMFASLFVYVSLMTCGIFALDRLGAFDTVEMTTALEITLWKPVALDIFRPVPLNPTLWLAVAIVLLLALLSLTFSIRSRRATASGPARYKWSIREQRLIGWGLTAVILLLLVGSLPHVDTGLHSAWLEVAAASLSTITGAVLGVLQFLRQQRCMKSSGGILSGLHIIVGAFALVYGLLLIAYVVGTRIDSTLATALLIISILVGASVNLNFAGLHRMYRDRLMETFMPDAGSVEQNRWGPAMQADSALLETMCGNDNRRPYHLINTNIVLVDSPTAKYHGRGGDSFLLSPLFCGSDATGWRRTRKYIKGPGRRGMTLPTAMAISGAAANPNTGVAGRGVTRNKFVSLLMSLLNLRLGYWAPNPAVDRRSMIPPNFLVPGLRSGVCGRGLNERKGSVELSDGGHFENLGLYELIRRKLDLIVVSDAGADPAFRFQDLANVIERVRVDFGAEIHFDEEFSLEHLRPGSAGGNATFDEYELARRGFAVANILYEKGPGDDTQPRGILIYLKTTLTGLLTEDIYGYKRAHSSFPDQTTSDQFFDETQFEAYRELGYQLTLAMLKENASRGWIG
ncbi:MAG: hypothetical protein ACE5HV_08735 [Acidobacteriota bacterium]